MVPNGKASVVYYHCNIELAHIAILRLKANSLKIILLFKDKTTMYNCLSKSETFFSVPLTYVRLLG